MTDAPERIWLDWPDANRGDVVYDEPPERDTQPGQTAYIRGDIHAAALDLLAKRDAELARLHDGSRPLPFDRDTVGRMVREAWVRWAETQPSPKPSWLVPYDDLAEPDKEADRQIGEAVARWTLAFDAAHAALTPEPTDYERKVAQMKEDFPNGI